MVVLAVRDVLVDFILIIWPVRMLGGLDLRPESEIVRDESRDDRYRITETLLAEYLGVIPALTL